MYTVPRKVVPYATVVMAMSELVYEELVFVAVKRRSNYQV